MGESTKPTSNVAPDATVSRRRVIEQIAGLGVIAISMAVIVYVLFLVVVGASWTDVPESPSGSPAGAVTVFRPVPLEPALIAFVTASFVILGIALRVRGGRWGLHLAWIGAASLTIFGAIFIFGSFGVIFLAGLALLALIAVFAWFGRDRSASSERH
jgi:hypothetical protein